MNDFLSLAATWKRYPDVLLFRGKRTRGIYYRPPGTRYTINYCMDPRCEAAVPGKDFWDVPAAFAVKMSIDKLRVVGTRPTIEAAVQLHDEVLFHFWTAFKTRPALNWFYDYQASENPREGAPAEPKEMANLAGKIFGDVPPPKVLSLAEWAAANPAEYSRALAFDRKLRELLAIEPALPPAEVVRLMNEFIRKI